MNIKKNITIHLSEDNLKSLIAEYLKEHENITVNSKDIKFKIGQRCCGFGAGEHIEKVFEGCDVNVMED